MTKKLRCKFVCITMTIVTLMLCIIMSMIYIFMKINLENNSINMLQNIATNPFLQYMPNELSDDMRLPYFILHIGPQGELMATGGGYYNLSDETFLEDLMEAAFSSHARTGVVEEYGLRYYHLTTPVSQVLVYADISSEQLTLRNLRRNCIFIGAACFLIFLSISFFLAGWAIKPVEQAWEQQRRFVADASHELKTPLTVIMTNAQLMQDPGYSEDSRAAFSSNILVMSRQMKSLVEQMLVLARADSFKQEPPLSPVNFSQIVSDALLPFEPVFFEKGLTLKTDIADPVMIHGDPEQLRRLLDILLDNAAKYSMEKGTAWVTLHTYGKGRCLLAVANEGQEISEDDLPHLFKRFYRADQARRRTGSFGLGLSIAETIVRRHKGTIWAESKNNVNTFFVAFGGRKLHWY